MTFRLPLTLVVFLTLSFQISFGQKSIFGTWTGSCPIEKTDEISMTFCDLCPMVSKGNSISTIGSFEITFNKDELKLNIGGKTTTTKYIWDELVQTLEFRYNEINYRFNVLMGGPTNLQILKSEGGHIVVLTKKTDGQRTK